MSKIPAIRKRRNAAAMGGACITEYFPVKKAPAQKTAVRTSFTYPDTGQYFWRPEYDHLKNSKFLRYRGANDHFEIALPKITELHVWLANGVRAHFSQTTTFAVRT